MLQSQSKDISIGRRPPEPSDDGLSNWDKNFITDDQSGPFYGDQVKIRNEAPKSAPTQQPLRSGSYSFSQATITLCLALVLLFMILFIIVVICLMNGQSVAGGAGVHKMSWGVFSQAIAIFCAFLIFNSLKDVIHYHIGKYLLQTAMLLLLVKVVVAHSQLFIVRHWPLTLVGTGMVYSYAISFAMIDIFELAEQLSVFTQADFLSRSSLLILAAFGIVGFIVATTGLREGLESCLTDNERCRSCWSCCCCFCFDADTVVGVPSWNEWKKRAGKSEDQIAAVTIGYLLSQGAEHAILLASAEHPSSFNSQAMALVTASFAVLSICVALWTSTGPCKRFSLATLSTCLIATDWCLFHAVQWQYGRGYMGEILGLQPNSFRTSLLVALTTSFISLVVYMMICFYSLAFQASPWSDALLGNFQALAAAMGFALALPWVSCFAVGVPELLQPNSQLPVFVPVAVVVCALVLPIWAVHVLPRTSMGKAVEGQ